MTRFPGRLLGSFSREDLEGTLCVRANGLHPFRNVEPTFFKSIICHNSTRGENRLMATFIFLPQSQRLQEREDEQAGTCWPHAL